MTIRLVASCLAVLVLSSVGAAEEYAPGDRVVIVRFNAKFERNGRTAAEAELGNAYYVSRVDDDRLYVRLVDGWIPAENVLPYDKALPYFDSLVERAPGLSVSYLCRGIFLMKKGDLDAAEADMTKAIELSPDQASYYIGRGNVRWRSKHYEDAVADFDKAIELNPYDFAAWNGRGLAYRGLKQYDKAIADFTEAIEIEPGKSSLWGNRGMTRASARDFRGAVEDHSESHRLAPRDPEPLRRRALDRWELHDYDGALRDFAAALKLVSHPVQILIDRGDRFASIGQYREAIIDYNSAVYYRMNDHRGYAARGWLLATCPVDEFRNPRQALSDTEISCRLTNYKGRWNLECLAAAFAENERYDEAVKWQRAAIEQIPTNASAASRESSLARLKLYEQRQPYRMPLPWQLRPPVEAAR